MTTLYNSTSQSCQLSILQILDAVIHALENGTSYYTCVALEDIGFYIPENIKSDNQLIEAVRTGEYSTFGKDDYKLSYMHIKARYIMRKLQKFANTQRYDGVHVKDMSFNSHAIGFAWFKDKSDRIKALKEVRKEVQARHDAKVAEIAKKRIIRPSKVFEAILQEFKVQVALIERGQESKFTPFICHVLAYMAGAEDMANYYNAPHLLNTISTELRLECKAIIDKVLTCPITGIKHGDYENYMNDCHGENFITVGFNQTKQKYERRIKLLTVLYVNVRREEFYNIN